MKIRDLPFIVWNYISMLFQGKAESYSSTGDDWMNAPKRPAMESECALFCKHCQKRIGLNKVRQCPECMVVFHAGCYEDTEGGNAFASEGCKACRHRTYWR